jgi:hypothetical protein
MGNWSQYRPADSSGNLIEVYAKLTTPGTSLTTVKVYQNGTDPGDLIATLAFPAGETVAEADLVAAKVYRNVDIFRVHVEGDGVAEGLNVQVRAI